MQSEYFGVRFAAHVSLLALAACGGASRMETMQGSGGTAEGGVLGSGGFTGVGGSNGGTRGSGGSAGSGAGGMLQAGGAPSAGGRPGGAPSAGGRPGSGGQGVDGGGDSDTSPGTTSIKIEICGSDPHCFSSNCGEGPAIAISDSEGHVLDVRGSCGSLSCESCSPRLCPGPPCQPQTLPLKEASLVWDGSIFVRSTCGVDASCTRRSYATPGRYTATFCTQDALVAVDGGPSHCVVGGPMKCIELPFDFPSSVPVVGSLGCSNVDDACHKDSDCCSGPDNGVNGRKLSCVGMAGNAYCVARLL